MRQAQTGTCIYDISTEQLTGLDTTRPVTTSSIIYNKITINHYKKGAA